MNSTLNVRILVQEFDALFHAPQATLHTANNSLRNLISTLGELNLDVREDALTVLKMAMINEPNAAVPI